MRFNRRLGHIKAISFDLDDTLYSNKQVMLDTDLAMQTFFQALFSQQFPEIYQKLKLSNGDYQQCDHNFWWHYRNQVLLTQPELVHDVGALRIATYQYGLQQLGIEEGQAQVMTEQAMAHFLHHRNQVTVPAEIHEFLTELAKRFPLVAISNGNVCTQTIGLKKYFQMTYHAGNGFRQKPEADLFLAALTKLNIAPTNLLHVGDCGKSDIKGALRAGCRSAWLNCYDVGQPITVLSDIELNQVTDLLKLFT